MTWCDDDDDDDWVKSSISKVCHLIFKFPGDKCEVIVAIILCSVSVVVDESVHVLDLAAKLDQTAEFICKTQWGEIDFPPPFGREAYPEVRLVCPEKISNFCQSSGELTRTFTLPPPPIGYKANYELVSLSFLCFRLSTQFTWTSLFFPCDIFFCSDCVLVYLGLVLHDATKKCFKMPDWQRDVKWSYFVITQYTRWQNN